MSEPTAKVHVIDGQIVLEDPTAVGMIRAVGKHNCIGTMESQTDRVAYFEKRMEQRGDNPDAVVIVLINVDDTELSRGIADTLMPRHDWQVYRDEGEIPFARGLAGREGIQGMLDDFDKEAAAKLTELAGQVAVIVFDHGVAEVFPAT